MRNFNIPSTNSGFVGKSARKLLSTTALTAAGIMALYTPALAADDWSDHQIVDGSTSVTIDDSAQATNIIQNTHSVKARGDGDIKAGWTVNLNQQSSSSKYVLYDIESDPTFIRGNLNANGQVYIFDQNGVIFGDNSTVDVGSIVAGAGNANYADVISGKFDITDIEGDVRIDEQATITVGEAGLASFVGRNVSNNGVINAKLGTVSLAAGEKATLDMNGDGLFEVSVEGDAADTLIENAGTINAEGGRVLMTASAAKDAIDNVINVDGIVNVSSATVKGGKIVLSGGNSGTVTVSGSLQANGQQGGGEIEVTGENVDITETAQVEINAGQSGDGGTAYIYGNEYAIFRGDLFARGGANGGNGGNVEVSGGEAVGYDGLVDLSALNGDAGTLLIDPRHLTISNSAISGVIADILSGGLANVNINAKALANTLALSNVNLWATETLSTGDDIDLSIGTVVTDIVYGGFFSGCFFGCPVFDDVITDGTLTIAAPEVNLLHDITLGTGGLNIYDLAPGTSVLGFGLLNVPGSGIDVDTVNLDGTIFKRTALTDPAFTTLADLSQLDGEAHTVNVLSDSASINQGIQFAESGATVNVGAGTYSEDVIVDRSLTLNGANAGTSAHDPRAPETIIDPTIRGFEIQSVADNTTIDGFLVEGGETGIFVDGADNATIKNNILRDQNELTNPAGSGAGDGVFLFLSSGSTVSDNLVEGQADDGVMGGLVEDITITNNKIIGNANSDNGVELRFARGDNTVSGNKISGGGNAGILATDSADTSTITIGGATEAEGNTIEDTVDGIVVENTFATTIQFNEVDNVSGDGIRGVDVTTLDILDNHIKKVGGGSYNEGQNLDTKGDNGIETQGGSDIGIKDNVVERGSRGIASFGGSDIEVDNNTVGGTGFYLRDGIYASEGVDGWTVTNNTVSQVFYDGIEAENKIIDLFNSNITITGNTLRNIGVNAHLDDNNGVRVEDANGDVVVNTNTIENVFGKGIEIKRATNGAEVDGNDVMQTVLQGIHIEQSGGSDVTNNFVGVNGGASIGDHGISIINGGDHLVSGNDVSNVGNDGINITDFEHAEVAYNTIINTANDGIDVTYGDSANIYGNVIEGAGFNIGSVACSNGNNSEGDGIFAAHIGLNDVAVEPTTENGYGAGSVGEIAELNIYENAISIVKGDGIDATDNTNVYINSNLIGHTDDDGIAVNGFVTTEISENSITAVGDDGIFIRGNTPSLINDEGPSSSPNDDRESIYAGVFNNKLLLVTSEGIQINEVGDDQETPPTMRLGGNDSYGWNVNVDGNEVFMTGLDGIEADSNGSIRVANNNVFMAGMGIGQLGSVIDDINLFASFAINPPTVPFIAQQFITTQPSDPTFVWNGWLGSEGINISRSNQIGPNGWAVEVDNNRVRYTGGDGVNVRQAPNAYIHDNTIRFSGVDETEHDGYSMLDLLNTGPFAPEQHFGGGDTPYSNAAVLAEEEPSTWLDDEPLRRNLWNGQRLNRVVRDHITPNEVLAFDTADGINVSNVRSEEGDIVVPLSTAVSDDPYYGGGEEPFNPYIFDVLIDNNTVRVTGDDGIEVTDSGRTLIQLNTIRDAGYGSDEYYGSGDFEGADGIYTRNISARVYGEPYYGAGFEPYNGGGDQPEEPSFNYEDDENYALIIRENNIRRTADDGIEVVGTLESEEFDLDSVQTNDTYFGGYLGGTTDRVLIAENEIRDSGQFIDDFYFGGGVEAQDHNDYGNVGPDGFGHDGIHVRNVVGTIYDDPQQKQGPGGSYGTEGGFYGYAADVIDNDIRRTTDDGIEVFNSDSTLIALNTIRDAGTGNPNDDGPEGSILYGGADYYGSDGIHVRNVGGSYGGFLPTNVRQGPNGFEPFSVAIVDNDVRRTGDDGIEVVGEPSQPDQPYWGGYFGSIQTADDGYYGGYDGTGRTIILGNTVRDAGVSGLRGSLYFNYYDSREGSDSEGFYFGSRASYDGYGGDGIHTRGVGVVYDTVDIDVDNVQTANSGTPYGNGDYAVQIIDNDVRRTGDDGIEVVGVEGENNLSPVRDGYYGQVQGYVLGGVLVTENTVRDAGLAGGLSGNLYGSFDGFDFDDGYYSGNFNGYANLNFGNAGEDGYGADGIHVRGIRLYDDGSEGQPSDWTKTALPGSTNGYFGGYAVDVIDNRVRWTADDGIEVRDSDSTFIAENNIKYAGMLTQSTDIYASYSETRVFDSGYFGGYFGANSISQEVDGYYGGYFGTEYQNTYASLNGFLWKGGLPYEGSDRTGGDGIHVENVGSPLNGISTRSAGISNGDDAEFEQYDVVIYDNRVDTSADDGIEVSFSGRTLIEDNRVFNSGSAYFSGFEGSFSSDGYFGGYFGVSSLETSSIFDLFDGEVVDYNGYVDIRKSVGNSGYDRTGSDGIHVNNVFATGAESDDPYYGDGYFGDIGELINTDITSFDIIGNKVDNSADDGIQVVFSGNGLIDDNEVSNSGTASYFGNGYFGGPRAAVTSEGLGDSYFGGDFFGIEFDEFYYYGGSGSVDATGGDGINVENGFDPRFIKRRPTKDDRIRNVSTENVLFGPGYFLSTNVDITNNVVTDSADDGIEAIGVTDLFIDTNEVDVSGDDGITIVGYAGFYEEDEPYFGGDLETSVTFGGSIEPPRFEAIISNNIVDNSGTDGIQSDNYDLTNVDTNEVSNSGENGFFGSGPFHGDVIVSNNTFTDNRIGAQFESGLVDLTGEGNLFDGGEIGLRFAPFDFSVFAEDDDIITPLSFGPDNTFPYENVPTSGFADLVLVDNDGPGSDSLGDPLPYTNYGGTIGAQTFDGQSVFFVELDNGAFFNPGTPTILNGLDSTYIIPGEGPLTPADTNGVLSAAQFDFLESRVQHFPDTLDLGLFFFGFFPEIEQEDLFNIFDPAALGTSGLNVTVTGPVNIPGQTNVNNITPFAGGDEGDVSPESLNAIETAAGESEEAVCWGDTMNVASSGQVATLNYGTGIEETISAAAECSSTF